MNGKKVSSKPELEFYFGKVGAMIPLASMLVGILLLVLCGFTAAKTFWSAGVLALTLAFLLAKNKREFGDSVVKGLTNSVMAVMVIAFYMAGITAQLLKDGGLVQGLLWLTSEINMGPELIPVISFLICVLISVCTGTTGGTVSAVTPVMLPLAVSLGCNPALIMGAILSGSFFGDNLAPVSDTTIASSYTQEAEVPDVVRSRLKYSIIAGIGAAILYIAFGFSTAGAAAATTEIDPSAAKSLLLLASPVVLVISMIRGLSLVPALVLCNLVTIIIELIFGLTTFTSLVGPDGVIISGIEGMVFLTVFCVFIFALIQMLTDSGVFEWIIEKLTVNVKSPRQAEFVVAGLDVVVTLMTAAATASIAMVGPVIRPILKKYKIERCRGANLLDGIACGVGGLCFWNLSPMAAWSLALSTGAVPEDFSIISAMPYSFHCMLLLVVYFVAIITGWGRKFEE